MPLAAGEPIIELKTNILCLCKKNNFLIFILITFIEILYAFFIFFVVFYLFICLVIFHLHLISNEKHRRDIMITRQGKLLVAKGLSEKKIEFHNRQLGVEFLTKGLIATVARV